MGLVRFLYLLALGVWLGEIVFFSFIGAPAIFTVLERARAGEVTSAIFPRYYALGLGCGAVAAVSAFVLARDAARPVPWRVAVGCVLLGLLAVAWAAFVLQPEAHRLRIAMQGAAEGDPVRLAFGRVHRNAVLLNVAALVAGLAALGASAAALRE